MEKGKLVTVKNNHKHANKTGVIIGVSQSTNSLSCVIDFGNFEIDSVHELFLEVCHD